MSIPNRRLHVRVPMSLGVTVDGTSGRREARTSDISLGGCYVDAMHQVFDGEVLTLRFHLPAGDVTVQGLVVYNQWPTGFGVRFIEVSDEALTGLDAAISDHLIKHTSGTLTSTEAPPETSID